MAVNTGNYLKGFSDKAATLGAKAISSDFTLEIKGFEGNYLLAKQCPWPVLAPQGEIEIPGPLGTTSYQPQQIKTAMQGQVSFEETIAGTIDKMMFDLLTQAGLFDATIYEGTPTNYLRAKPIKGCFIQMDSPDRDWENRSQVLLFSGTMFFHYFGEVLEGNSSAYQEY
jgi:hypothetical protein